MDIWTHFMKWCQRPNMITLRTGNPGLGRLKLFRGAKAGAVSGAIYGALGTLTLNIALWVDFSWLGPTDPFRAHTLTLGNMLANLTAEGWFWYATIMGTIPGVIIGLLFGWSFVSLYPKLPGSRPSIKGIVMGFIQWICLCWLIATPWGWGTLLMSLGQSLLWGWMMGQFLVRERVGKL